VKAGLFELTADAQAVEAHFELAMYAGDTAELASLPLIEW
jgi:hypothetical protein